MTEIDTGTLQGRGEGTAEIDGMTYRYPPFVEKYLSRRKDGEVVDFEYDLGMDGTTRTLKRIMPHGGAAPTGGKNAAKSEVKLTSSEGVLTSIDGPNLVTIWVNEKEKHYGILPNLTGNIKDDPLPQYVTFAFNKACIIQELSLQGQVKNPHAYNASTAPASPDTCNVKCETCPDESYNGCMDGQGDKKQESQKVVTPTTEPQIIIHRHEGEKARPDSIEFSGTSKKAGLKVYFDAGDPAEALERVEQAFVVYDYAVREMQKRNGEGA
ncbi:MAG: hypothetical protein M0Q91_07505 [Methanoregula sp.]|jgi:hypothetical protein|nr:hypothetical protein [Methanoregula sp.]